MLQKPVHFHSMRVVLPIKAIYARLGFRKGVTDIKAAQQEILAAVIGEAEGIVRLKGATLTLGLKNVDAHKVELEDSTVFESSALARMLSGCDAVLLMGATAGQQIMDEIASATASEDLTRAVVLDAVASEMTDSGLDWIMDYVNQALLRKATRLTSARFSAGYGDFLLENQIAMHRLLCLDTIGVSITENCILLPEKSVTAVAGVSAATRNAQGKR